MTDTKFIIINDWEGGIPSGSISFINNDSYVVRFIDTRKTFNTSKYINSKKMAEEYRCSISLEKGLTINQYRHIQCDIEGAYIEMKLNNNYIAKIDKCDLQLTQGFKWRATKTKNPRMYHSKTSQHTGRYFHRLVLSESNKHVIHINGDTLDNRRKNLTYVLHPKKMIHINSVKKLGEWKGGIPQGSICIYNNKYLVRFTDGTRKTFQLESKQQADEYRVTESLNKGLTKNQYRHVNCKVEGEYIEMKLQNNHIAKFDVEDLKHAIKYNCYAHNGGHRHYMYQSNKNEKLIFHRILFPEYKQIDHINRDGLDNRRKNLRPVSSSENNLNQKTRTDNKSGKTGIHYSNYSKCWIVQWPEDGKRKKKIILRI